MRWGKVNKKPTGWTLYMDKELLWGDPEAIKLFSMREIPQVPYLYTFKVAPVIYYCSLNYEYVKMYIAITRGIFSSWGQSAWVYDKRYSHLLVANKRYYTHQRLNKEYLKNSKDWFEQWLVGMTDGDGCFSICHQNDNKWSLVFKIALSRYNLRALYYIKKELGIGSVTTDGTKGQILIRDRKKLEKVIFPIFDKYSLLTSKQFNYDRFKQAFFVLEDTSLTTAEKNEKLLSLKNAVLPENYISPAWNKAKLPLKSINDVSGVITKAWLVGFIEAEGSFYLVSKTPTRIVHAFGLTQKLDKIVLEGIKYTLHIPTAIRYQSKHGHYILDTTNSRAIENIIEYFHNTMKGMKSVEYRIWARSYFKHKGEYEELSRIREILRKLKTKLLTTSYFEDRIR